MKIKIKRATIDRPRVIVHMLMSLDERVTGSFLSTEVGLKACEEYYALHREYKAQGFICGRVTMEQSFTKGAELDLDKYEGVDVPDGDFVAKKADFYAISIDPRGILGWQWADIVDEDEGYNGAHIIEAVSERASKKYLAYLREKGISYLICGEERVDVCVLLEKLKALFGIEKVLLEGGPITDAEFLMAGVIDKINLVVTPACNADKEGDTLFHGLDTTMALRYFRLAGIKELENKNVLMCYESKK